MLVVLALFAAACALPSTFAGGYGKGGGSGGPNITEVTNLLDALVTASQECFQDLAAINTLCQIGSNRLKNIQSIGISSLNLENDKQDALIADFKDQVTGLFHKAADINALCDQTKSLVDSNTDILNGLAISLTAVADVDIEQDYIIGNLSDEADEVKEDLLDRLEVVISELDTGLVNATLNVGAVQDFLETRTCEYGLVTICPNMSNNVDFKTNFSETPNVVLGMVGYTVHLDTPGGNFLSYDNITNLLCFYPRIIYTNTTGFTFYLYDGSDGGVDVKYVYYNYMACQNLDDQTGPLVNW